MKKKLVLLGSIAAIAVACATVVSNDKVENKYTPRTALNVESISGADANGMIEWMQMAKEGFTNEDYQRALEEAKAMPQSRADFSWRDHGPDNIGGRTRAILVDQNDINHLYAGSVSGGLFQSFSRGNFWEQVTSFSENLAVSSICQTIDGTLYVGTGHSSDQSFGGEGSGLNGSGLYVSTDAAATWTQVTGTSGFNTINEVVCDTVNNAIWMATSSGLKRYTASGGIESITAGFGAGSCDAIQISKDGLVIVAASSGSKTYVSLDGGASFLEYSDGGVTSNPIEKGNGRIEYAISHERQDGFYCIYASKVNSSGKLQGIWRSADSGQNWTEIAPANTGVPGSFAPFETGGGGGQGNYDNVISVMPGNPNKIFLGGIDIYTWNTTGNWEQLTQWFLPPTHPQYAHADQHTQVWDKTGRLYVGNDGGVQISDDGGVTFYPANRGYSVTQFYDVGFSAHGDVIGGTQDNGTLANYHTNSTYQEHREVGGGDGFSADISYINRDILFGSVYYASIYRSSDRGSNTQSFSPPLNAAYGCTPGDVSGSGCGSFNTRYTLWENPNDLNSTDSILFIPSEPYSIGDEVIVPSATKDVNIIYTSPINVVFDDTLYANPGLTTQDTLVTGNTTLGTTIVININEVPSYGFITGGPSLALTDSITYFNGTINDTLVVVSLDLTPHFYGTNPLKPGAEYDMGDDSTILAVAWDTLKVQDPYQSWFALGLGSGQGVWMTRTALRFSAVDQGWFLVADDPSMSTVTAIQFSKDGDHLFIGCSNGKLFRLSGFGDVYTPETSTTPTSGDGDTLIDWNTSHSETTLTEIHPGGGAIFGIATDPQDPDHVVFVTGGAGNVYESTVAATTTGTASFSSISSGLPSQPFYACVIDREDQNIIMVGGEVGAFITTTGGGSDWENCSGPFGNTPVFDMGQNWRTWDEGCYRPGEIYVGTHGRGIWSTDEYLGSPDQDNLTPEKFIANIQVYPNPVDNIGNIAFELTEASNVTVQVFNLNGQIVSSIQENNVSAGANTIALETADLPNGTYIVRLVAGEMIETTKFIKH